MTRKIFLWFFAATGVILVCLAAAVFVALYWTWPHTPKEPSGAAESPSWGSLDWIINQAESRGDTVPPFVTDALSGPAADGNVHVLVLSSGGQYGAFGAGVVAGWSETGSRRHYDVVTGISVGSILAPIAFLGPKFDDSLSALVKEVATLVDQNPIDGTNPIILTKAFLGYGFGVSVQIQDLVRREYGAEFLDLVAQEHARGRNLYVASTDLTAEKAVIWDLGAIAGSGRPDRVKRFQDAIIASFAIPFLFPSVYIETGEPGTYAMHVDGGFLSPIFLTSLIENYEKSDGNFHVDVLLNRKLSRHGAPKSVPPVFIEIAPRLFRFVHNQLVPQTIDVLQLRSEVHGFVVRILAIPEELELLSGLDFKGREIEDLFQLGLKVGRQKSAWIALPPEGVPAYWTRPDEEVEDVERDDAAK